MSQKPLDGDWLVYVSHSDVRSCSLHPFILPSKTDGLAARAIDLRLFEAEEAPPPIRTPFLIVGYFLPY
jgi:hypothetical protein